MPFCNSGNNFVRSTSLVWCTQATSSSRLPIINSFPPKNEPNRNFNNAHSLTRPRLVFRLPQNKKKNRIGPGTLERKKTRAKQKVSPHPPQSCYVWCPPTENYHNTSEWDFYNAYSVLVHQPVQVSFFSSCFTVTKLFWLSLFRCGPYTQFVVSFRHFSCQFAWIQRCTWRDQASRNSST